MAKSLVGKNILNFDEFCETAKTIGVVHMEDTSRYKPKHFDSWKEFWENAKKGEMTFPTETTKCECCKEDKNPEDFVGAHIREAGNGRGNMYIYPLCNSCNDKYGKGKEKSPTFRVKKEKCVDFHVSDADIVEP